MYTQQIGFCSQRTRANFFALFYIRCVCISPFSSAVLDSFSFCLSRISPFRLSHVIPVFDSHITLMYFPHVSTVYFLLCGEFSLTS
jgi:hypothetical protein